MTSELQGAPALPITGRWHLPLTELRVNAVRSSGPGGQNVNKVNTKVEVRWNLLRSSSLPPHLRSLILESLAAPGSPKRMTGDGDLIVVSGRFREQARNREDALEKLTALLRALIARDPYRKATKPTRASKVRRVDTKKKVAQKKAARRRPPSD